MTAPLEDTLTAIDRLLAAPGPSPVLLLAAEPGSGRTALLEEAALRARKTGRETTVLPLDLEGFEDGEDGLAHFLAHQLAKAWGEEEEVRDSRRDLLAPLLPRLEVSLAGAAFLSLLVRAEAPESILESLPAEALADVPGGRSLALLLDPLTHDRRLVLHAVASGQLTDTLRRRLLEAARESSGLLLALSCSPRDEDAAVAPRAERLRLEIPAELLAEPALIPEGLDIQTADRLHRFLDLAALCGENVPADLLFQHLELTEEQREELLDVIDEELVDADEPLLIDHQYAHPSFTGLLTYSFRSPRLGGSLLASLPAERRERMASELLTFLTRSVPVTTRGMALLFLALAEHVSDPRMREAYQRPLRWWIGPGEVEELAAELAAGDETPDTLLEIARQTRDHWFPYRRLALLEAVSRRRTALSPAAVSDLHNLRAEVLADLGRLPEALEEAGKALESARAVHRPEHPEHAEVARALNTLGVLLRGAGRLPEAREHLEQALALQRSAATLSNLAFVLRDLGETAAARDHLQEALSLHRQAHGDHHPLIARHLGNLAFLSQELGDNEAALHYARPIVDLTRSFYGDGHPQTAQALTQVAGILRAAGRMEEARHHLDAALTVHRHVYGNDHPAVVINLNNLAAVERDLGDHDAAREHFQAAADLLHDHDHLQAASILANFAHFLFEKGEATAACGYLARAHAAALASFGEDHPATVQLRQEIAERCGSPM